MIKVIAIGKKMPKWIDDGIHHYQKQLKKFEIITIKNSNTITEGDKLLTHATGTIIAMDEKGVSLSSTGFAQKISQLQPNGDISFLIGGADGLSDEVREKAHMLISLSAMTLPHSLARLMLVEQIYRGISILNNHPYHREG